ncbi:NAD(P)H-hydrate epimerase [Daejeonella lutea]|uniref:NAD(P)H-hydrate epimerase n=1 Tax=Daejeonella lutea TaxID=572036 RepID=UPI0009A6DB20|nr:NAD(P)H-hydrate epimerase [Daejeonella lutea]
MQNLLTSAQIRDADAHTISIKSISSLDLMESASLAFVKEFEQHIRDKNILISIYCGNGNNGGDGLAIARILSGKGYKNIAVKVFRFAKKSTADFEANRARLIDSGISLTDLSEASQFPEEKSDLIIDGLPAPG